MHRSATQGQDCPRYHQSFLSECKGGDLARRLNSARSFLTHADPSLGAAQLTLQPELGRHRAKCARRSELILQVYSASRPKQHGNASW
eukprot:808227-Pyramimonas_sp.AAC.1